MSAAFPDGWSARELRLILDAMDLLPRWGSPDEPVLVDAGTVLVGSFHWSAPAAEWRFVPAWRPDDAHHLSGEG